MFKPVVIDDLEVADFVKDKLEENGKIVSMDLILEILQYELDFLKSKGVAK